MSRGLLLILALGAAAEAGPRRKQASPVDESAARLKKGIALYGNEKYGPALEELRAAYRLSPSWELLFHIALCQRRLQRYEDALQSFEKYLADGGDQVPASKRAAVNNELTELRALTGKKPPALEPPKAPLKVVLAIESTPGKAKVSIDGKPAGQTPLLMEIEVGKHLVTAEAPGHLFWQKEVDLGAEEKHALQVTMEPDEAAAGPQANRGRVPVAGILIAAVGAAALGGSIALSAHAAAQSREVTELYRSGGRWDAYYDARQAAGERAETASILLGIGGGLVLATGLIVTLATLAAEPEGEVEVVPEEGSPVENARLLLAPLPSGGALAGVSFQW